LVFVWCLVFGSWSLPAAVDPYVKHILTTNSLTLGTNLTLVSGVLEATGGGTTGGGTIWTNTPAGSVQLLAPTNYLALGVSADTWFGTSTNNLLVGVHDVTAGDPPVAIFNIAAVDDAASVTNYADIYFRGDSANGAANFSIDSFNGTTSTILNLSMTPDDIIAALYAGGTARTILNPTVTSSGSATAYTFDTKNSLTNGDATVTFANAGTPYIYAGPGGSPALSVTSLASDNATNVALVVDTSVPWTTGALLAAFANKGTNVAVISPYGGIGIGASVVNFGGPQQNSQVLDALHVTSLGDSEDMTLRFDVTDDSNYYNDALLRWATGFVVNTVTNIYQVWMMDGYTTNQHSHWEIAGYAGDDVSSGLLGVDSSLFWADKTFAKRLYLRPEVISTGSATAYTFDTANVLTNGDALVTFKNAGVQVANLTPSGSLTLSGTTNQLADSGSALTYNGVAIATTITNSFGVHLDGGGLVLATGLAGYSTIVNGGTIQSCIMLADQTGSAVVDIWRCTYGQFDAGSTHPVAGDKITSSAPPTILSAVKSTNALTGWSLTVTNGDVIAWSVTACTNITKLDISVTTTR